VLWPRANARGALAALLTGLVLGFTRLALELNRGSLSGAAEWLASINFLHFAILLFALCSAVLVIVSLLTRPPDAARVEPLTIRYYRESAGAQPSRAADILLSAALAGLVAAAWIFFS
jgi:SSS family solute:Na+ symporter